MLSGGLGTVQDDDVAFEYLHEAGEDIDNLWESITVKVLTALGVAYAFGRGTEADIELGYQYFEDAAKLGSKKPKSISATSTHRTMKPTSGKRRTGHSRSPVLAECGCNDQDAVAADLREILDASTMSAFTQSLWSPTGIAARYFLQ